MNGNVYLVGMMGSGKTMVAQLLSKRLRCAMVEMDALIVQQENMTINEVFSGKGEPYFRSAEKKILQDIAKCDNQIVSTGGGVILSESNINLMRETGIMIYLKASTDELYTRLQDKTDRPLLKCESPKDELDKIFENRSVLYEQAHYTIDTSDKMPDEIIGQIMQLLECEHLL